MRGIVVVFLHVYDDAYELRCSCVACFDLCVFDSYVHMDMTHLWRNGRGACAARCSSVGGGGGGGGVGRCGGRVGWRMSACAGLVRRAVHCRGDRYVDVA